MCRPVQNSFEKIHRKLVSISCLQRVPGGWGTGWKGNAFFTVGAPEPYTHHCLNVFPKCPLAQRSMKFQVAHITYPLLSPLPTDSQLGTTSVPSVPGPDSWLVYLLHLFPPRHPHSLSVPSPSCLLTFSAPPRPLCRQGPSPSSGIPPAPPHPSPTGPQRGLSDAQI